MIKAEVHGQAQLRVALEKKIAEFSDVLERAVLKSAAPLKDYASALAPRGRSGGLARSMRVRLVPIDGPRAQVRVGPAWEVYDVSGVVEYGRFAEFGTLRMAAHPFLRPALDMGKEEVLRILKEELGRAIT